MTPRFGLCLPVKVGPFSGTGTVGEGRLGGGTGTSWPVWDTVSMRLIVLGFKEGCWEGSRKPGVRGEVWPEVTVWELPVCVRMGSTGPQSDVQTMGVDMAGPTQWPRAAAASQHCRNK